MYRIEQHPEKKNIRGESFTQSSAIYQVVGKMWKLELWLLTDFIPDDEHKSNNLLLMYSDQQIRTANDILIR